MQTFALTDIPSVLLVAFLQLILSGDNAIILGLISSSLPKHLQRKALFIGVVFTFIFSALSLLFINYLLRYFWIQLLGALYLLFLSIRHFVKKNSDPHFQVPPHARSFWKTVLLIEAIDIVFSLDSAVAGIAIIPPSSLSINPKLWVVYTGAMIGLLGTRYAAGVLSSFVHHFPYLESSAYALIALIGLKMALASVHFHFPYDAIVFWTAIAATTLLGFIRK